MRVNRTYGIKTHMTESTDIINKCVQNLMDTLDCICAWIRRTTYYCVGKSQDHMWRFAGGNEDYYLHSAYGNVAFRCVATCFLCGVVHPPVHVHLLNFCWKKTWFWQTVQRFALLFQVSATILCIASVSPFGHLAYKLTTQGVGRYIYLSICQMLLQQWVLNTWGRRVNLCMNGSLTWKPSGGARRAKLFYMHLRIY